MLSGPLLWVTIATMAILTYALRTTFLLLHERVQFPPLMHRALRYVPYAVMAALVVSALFGGMPEESPRAPRLLAAVIGALVAWRTGSVLLTLGLGMGVLWLSAALL